MLYSNNLVLMLFHREFCKILSLLNFLTGLQCEYRQKVLKSLNKRRLFWQNVISTFYGVVCRPGSLRNSYDKSQGTSINDVPYWGRQGGPKLPQKRDVVEQDKVGRQVKNDQKMRDVINGCSLIARTRCFPSLAGWDSYLLEGPCPKPRE